MRDELAVVTGVSGNLGPIWIDALADAGARVVGIDLEAVAPGEPSTYGRQTSVIARRSMASPRSSSSATERRRSS